MILAPGCFTVISGVETTCCDTGRREPILGGMLMRMGKCACVHSGKKPEESWTREQPVPVGLSLSLILLYLQKFPFTLSLLIVKTAFSNNCRPLSDLSHILSPRAVWILPWENGQSPLSVPLLSRVQAGFVHLPLNCMWQLQSGSWVAQQVPAACRQFHIAMEHRHQSLLSRAIKFGIRGIRDDCVILHKAYLLIDQLLY